MTERGNCMTLQDTFLENLEKEMLKKNISYYQIAKNTKISNSTFANWKKRNANPTIDKLVEVCRFLDVSSDKLLGLPEREPPDFTEEEIYLVECYRKADKNGKEMIRRICDGEGNVKSAKLSNSQESNVLAQNQQAQ